MLDDSFSGYHPVDTLLYFVLVIGFSMFLMHPVCLGLSLVSALLYAIRLSGRRAIRLSLFGLLPLLLLTAALNPLFNHEGATIITYLPDGNPLTLEAIWYGLAAAVMLVTVILWFSCYQRVMSSDKVLYLFGRVAPALSLIFSMTLGFVPRFGAKLKHVMAAQRAMGRSLSSGSVIRRVKNAVSIFSILLTWALESAVTTADSMKSRGYGLRGRTTFSLYRFDRRDAAMLFFLLLMAVVVIICAAAGGLSWQYYPLTRGTWAGGLSIAAYGAYLMLCLSPVIVDWRESRKWNALRSGL